jgi:hypothetical protein
VKRKGKRREEQGQVTIRKEWRRTWWALLRSLSPTRRDACRVIEPEAAIVVSSDGFKSLSIQKLEFASVWDLCSLTRYRRGIFVKKDHPTQ